MKLPDTVKERIIELYRNDLAIQSIQCSILERNYFNEQVMTRIPDINEEEITTKPKKRVKLLSNNSFDNIFEIYKTQIQNYSNIPNNPLEEIYQALTNYFLFSAGNDFIFRKRIEVDNYNTRPIDNIILPIIMRLVEMNLKEKDIGTEKETTIIQKNIQIGLNISSILWRLYCDNFVPTIKTRDEIIKKDYNSVKLLKRTKVNFAIGDFYRELIDYKFDIICDIFNSISDPKAREATLEAINIDRLLKKYELGLIDKNGNNVNPSYYDRPLTYFIFSNILDTAIKKRK